MTDEVKFQYNATTKSYEVARVKLSDIIADVRDRLNAPEEAKVFVNGNEVSEGYVLTAGDTVEFYKSAGEKGSL